MRENPEFQLGSAEFPSPEIMIGGYAPLACSAPDSLRMKAPGDGGSGGALEKRFNGLNWTAALGRRRIKSIERH